MLKVIVAEDEYFARKVLVKMLQEAELEIGEIREAETGVEVLELLEQEAADVVITDIRMPEMDGLELAERLSQEYKETKVIIESGYSDFNYAKSAIKYGVRDYLTKPVNSAELAAAIGKIAEEQKVERQKLVMDLAERRIPYMDFSYLLEREEIGAQVMKQAEDTMRHSDWSLCVAQNEENRMTDRQIERILEILERPVGKLQASAYYFGVKSEFIIIFSADTKNRALLETIVGNKVHACELEENIRLTAGISQNNIPAQDYLKSLSAAYREAVYALNQRLLRRENNVFSYVNEVNVAKLFGIENERNLERYLTEHKTEKAAALVEEFFTKCGNNRDITIYSLFTSVIQIMNVINRVYGMRRQQEEDDAEKGAYLMFSFKTDLYSYHSMEELKEYIVQLMEDVGEEGEPESTIIADLLNYLERNYQYDISVNELAAHKYFVSPSYLSRLFKAETGENFSRYLMRLRMEKARELLKETTLKISDIAAYVGYNDVSYFIQTFKKQNNMTPEQFRNLC